MYEETNGKSVDHASTARALPDAIDGSRLRSIEMRARRLDRQARHFIREHPTTVVIAAVAIGFLVGRLVRS